MIQYLHCIWALRVPTEHETMTVLINTWCLEVPKKERLMCTMEVTFHVIIDSCFQSECHRHVKSFQQFPFNRWIRQENNIITKSRKKGRFRDKWNFKKHLCHFAKPTFVGSTSWGLLIPPTDFFLFLRKLNRGYWQHKI